MQRSDEHVSIYVYIYNLVTIICSQILNLDVIRPALEAATNEARVWFVHV